MAAVAILGMSTIRIATPRGALRPGLGGSSIKSRPKPVINAGQAARAEHEFDVTGAAGQSLRDRREGSRGSIKIVLITAAARSRDRLHGTGTER